MRAASSSTTRVRHPARVTGAGTPAGARSELLFRAATSRRGTLVRARAAWPPDRHAPASRSSSTANAPARRACAAGGSRRDCRRRVDLTFARLGRLYDRGPARSALASAPAAFVAVHPPRSRCADRGDRERPTRPSTRVRRDRRRRRRRSGPALHAGRSRDALGRRGVEGSGPHATHVGLIRDRLPKLVSRRRDSRSTMDAAVNAPTQCSRRASPTSV